MDDLRMMLSNLEFVELVLDTHVEKKEEII
jgi:hypothetical protein